MSTLLLRLAGPMQSWGTQSRFSVRDTGREPSKSGVIGLLCAALGRPREAPLTDLAALRLGVRVDREGALAVDYHTTDRSRHVGEGYGASRSNGSTPRIVLSQRYYLADASFLVGLEGDGGLLRELDEALGDPVWPLFLGRKSFVPGEPVRLLGGLRPEPLREALRLTRFWPAGKDRPLRFVVDAAAVDPGEPEASSEIRQDVPISFQLGRRAFASRRVVTTFLPPLEAPP